MNHIKKLQIDAGMKDALAGELLAGIGHLKSYLCSEKFHVDTTVQVADVMHRLQEIIHNAGNVEQDYINAAYKAAREEEEKRKAKHIMTCEEPDCGKYGKDWIDADVGGYSMILCHSCYERKLAAHEILGGVE